MKQDSRSPEQNRSLHPLLPDIESRVYIHKAILRKNINFKTDSFWFYSQTSFLEHTVIYMTPLKVGFSTSHIGGFYPSYMELRRKGGGSLKVTKLKWYICTIGYCAAHGTFRYSELCSICLREGLGRSKPATNPWNKHNNTTVEISTISKPYWTVFYRIKWTLQVWAS